MCANIAFTNRDLPSKRHVQRLRLANGKHIDVKDVKAAMDIIIGPSLRLWKFGVARSVASTLKRAPKPMVPGDNISSASSETPKKKVRFNEKPVKMSRRWFFDRYRKNSCSSPPRPCLVIRERDDVVHHIPPKPSVVEVADCNSVYEDCLAYHPDFVLGMEILQGNDMPTRKHVRRSDFYEIEDGVAVFDRAGYANYCLSKWLDKQREVWAPKKRVFEDQILPSRTLSPLPPPPPPNSPSIICRPIRPLPAIVSRPPRSLPQRIWKYIDDEFHNAIFVLTVGLLIHMCLYVFLLYDILTRGLFPSDD